MVNVSRAVHHAHQHRILHRDLKPSNILLDADENKADRPCVCDFGLGKPIDGAELERDSVAESASEGTGRGQIVGTASFMSPEQANGKKLTTLSDVYGLGTILYALQTGEPPFLGKTVRETLRQVSDPERNPRSPREVNPRIDRTLEAICLKCLDKQPRNRYHSAEGLARDLDRWLAYLPSEANPPKLAERLRLWSRRNPVGLGLAAVLVALLTLVGLNVADRLGEPRWAQATLARQQAETLGIRLRQLTQAITPVAADGRLGELLMERNQPALQAFIEEAGNSRVDLSGLSPFESWFVIDGRDGAILARWPEMSRDTEGVDFSSRDYSEGLSGPGTYVSQVYKALSDDLYKFGISAWVRLNGENVGVVVATVTTSRQMGLPGIEDPGFVTALLARKDSYTVAGETGMAPEGASDFVILLHPAYERRIEPVWFPRKYLAGLESGSVTDYQDPVASLNNESAEDYTGRWVVSFAPVADSEFIVLVQQRYAPVVPRELLFVMTVLLAAIFLTLAVKYVLGPTKPVPV